MVDTTTAEPPSHAIRKLIVQATDEGMDLERRVEAFATQAHRAAREFAREIGPLHLPDQSYVLVTGACGLSALLDLAYRMQTTLAAMTEA